MKKNYINPRSETFQMNVESLLAASENLQRANGGGTNTAEVKGHSSADYSNPVNWDE